MTVPNESAEGKAVAAPVGQAVDIRADNNADWTKFRNLLHENCVHLVPGKKVIVNKDSWSTSIRVSLPAGENVPQCGWGGDLVTMKPAAPDAPTPSRPLTAADYRRVKLSALGVKDNSVSSDVLREMGNYDVDQGRFLVDGLILDRGVNLLAGSPKGGKTTFLKSLLRAGAGKDPGMLLGRRVEPFNALVVSEEARSEWSDPPANARLVFPTTPPIRKAAEWEAFVDGLQKIARTYQGGNSLIVIDSLAAVLGATKTARRR